MSTLRCLLSSALSALLALPLLLPGRPAAALGSTYYVAPTGSDLNAGTAAAPFRQIRRALLAAGAGDTILVADGSYLGFDVRNKHGAPGQPLVIRAVGSGAVVTPTTDRSDNRDTIFVTYSSWIVLDGLRSFNANRAAVRVDQSPNITVRNGVFGNNTTWGIFTDFSDDLLLEFNECYGSLAEHGIYVSNSGDRPVCRGNVLYDNRGSGLQLNADVFAGGDGLITGALIENNVAFNNGRGGGAAINLDGVQDSVIRNNLLFDNHATGIVAYDGDGAAGPRGLLIAHNTVDQPSDGRWALHIGGTAGPNTVRNNILFTRHSFRGSIEYFTPADAAATDSDYNVLSKVTPDYGINILTLAQWQAQGRELHSRNLAESALWVDAAARDYRLRAGSPAIDAGATLPAVAVDLTGAARPQGAASDIGSYEAGGAPPPPPDTTPPAAPTGAAVQAGDARLTVTWNANTEADLAGYHVYRAEASGGPFVRQTASVLTARSLLQTGLVNGKTYWYRVTALDQTGNESLPGTAVSGTPQAPVVVPRLSTLTLSPTLVKGGKSATGTVTLTAPAPAGGATVTLSSNHFRATVPAAATVPAGALTARFTVKTTRPARPIQAVITATSGGVSRTASLTVNP
jgi:hypothetical protein